MAAGISGLLAAMYGFYNTIFQPLLAMGPYVSLGFFSAVLAGIFSVVHWHLLDIEKADEIKEKLNERQEKMKEARKSDNGDEASEHMQKTMELNQKLMKLNMKPMLGTMVFVALIFPWLGATFAPSIDMTETSNDMYEGNLSYAGEHLPLKVDNSSDTPVVMTAGQNATIDETFKALGVEWQVVKFGPKSGGFFSSGNGIGLKLNAEFVELPFSLPFIGGALNWLGFYILIAMPLTFGLRKVLGVA